MIDVQQGRTGKMSDIVSKKIESKKIKLFKFRSRSRAIEEAQREGHDCVILDDGLQDSSIVKDLNASPENSIAAPVPPAVPILPITARIKSFAVIPRGKLPLTVTRILRHFVNNRVCVARTCSTSDVPIPKDIEPKAP